MFMKLEKEGFEPLYLLDNVYPVNKTVRTFVMQAENLTNGDIENEMTMISHGQYAGRYVAGAKYGERTCEWECIVDNKDVFEVGERIAFLSNFFTGQKRIKITVLTDYGKTFVNYMFPATLPEIEQMSQHKKIFSWRQQVIMEWPFWYEDVQTGVDLTTKEFFFTTKTDTSAHKLLPTFFGKTNQAGSGEVTHNDLQSGVVVRVEGTWENLIVENTLPNGKKQHFKLMTSATNPSDITELWFPTMVAKYTLNETTDLYPFITPDSEMVYLDPGKNLLKVTSDDNGIGFGSVQVGYIKGQAKI